MRISDWSSDVCSSDLPRLLVLDEPTEGLAPVVVRQVEELLATLAAEGDVAILLIEQNIAVATAIAGQVAILVNGRIPHVMPARQLSADRALQRSEEHTSELQSLMRPSYAVFCFKKKNTI